MNEICRVCVQVADNIISDIQDYSVIIKNIAQIDIILEGGLSTKICNDCVTDLLRANTLRELLLQCNSFKVELIDDPEIKNDEFSFDNGLLLCETYNTDSNEDVKPPDLKFNTDAPQHIVKKTEEIKTPKNQEAKKKRASPKKNNDELKYFCHRCSTPVKKLPLHMKMQHPNEPLEFKCQHCDKTTDKITTLQTHIHCHHRPFEVCDECGATFKRKSRLKEHKVSIHMQLKEFECDYCHAKFARRCGLVSHIRVHIGYKPFKCKYCPKAYNYYSDYRTHEMTHTGEWARHCPICNKGFYKPSTLKNHMKCH